MVLQKTMKLKTLLISVFLLGTVSVASAQNESYGKVYASFNLAGVSLKGGGVVSSVDIAKATNGNDNVSMNGFNVGLLKGINLTKSAPLFLEIGGEVNYLAGSEQMVDFKMLNFQVPVNLTYRIPVCDGFAIAPYAGLNFKVNILGLVGSSGVNYSLFSDDDVALVEKYLGVKNYDPQTANRFQLGMNAGVNFVIAKKLCIGYRFQPDFIDYYKYDFIVDKYPASLSLATSSHSISIGYIF